MYSAFTLGRKYLNFWCKASNGKGHGIHSPFVYDFVAQVLNDRGAYYCYAPIEAARKDYLLDESSVEVEDFGAGSRSGAKKLRRISSIATTALKPKKYGQLLFRMANHYQCTRALELGTSLGITTCYLASASSASKVLTLEGAPAIAAVAGRQFAKANLNNIKQLVGPFEETLSKALQAMPHPNLVYIDGNHRREPTLRYFHELLPHILPQTILVFDDIYWSREMETAWAEIKAHPAVTLTIDLFFLGIVFFSADFKVKQHFSIRF